jgi:hypothetical protein
MSSVRRGSALDRLASLSVFMQTGAAKIILIAVGVILLTLGLLNTVPDVLHFFNSNTASSTLMIKTHWLLMVVCGMLLLVVGFFITSNED